MLDEFCLRLALGAVACLLLLSPARTARPAPGRPGLANPNFFRTQMLVALALATGCLLWSWNSAPPAVLACLVAGGVFCFLGSITWSLERSPGGVSAIVLATLAFVLALGLREPFNLLALLGSLSAAALLGASLSAMLLGHNYLVSPGMSMTPLYRLLAAFAMALVVRSLIEGYALVGWTSGRSLANLTMEQSLWLPFRWGIGLLAPAILCAMAWQTARIRSTQSATGILYVAVIFCFLGELTSQALLRPSGLTL